MTPYEDTIRTSNIPASSILLLRLLKQMDIT